MLLTMSRNFKLAQPRDNIGSMCVVFSGKLDIQINDDRCHFNGLMSDGRIYEGIIQKLTQGWFNIRPPS